MFFRVSYMKTPLVKDCLSTILTLHPMATALFSKLTINRGYHPYTVTLLEVLIGNPSAFLSRVYCLKAVKFFKVKMPYFGHYRTIFIQNSCAIMIKVYRFFIIIPINSNNCENRRHPSGYASFS